MIMNDWQSREGEEQRVKIEKIGSDKGKKINKEKRRSSKQGLPGFHRSKKFILGQENNADFVSVSDWH